MTDTKLLKGGALFYFKSKFVMLWFISDGLKLFEQCFCIHLEKMNGNNTSRNQDWKNESLLHSIVLCCSAFWGGGLWGLFHFLCSWTVVDERKSLGGTCIAHMSPTAHWVRACARVLRMFSRACCFCNCVFLTQNFRTLGYMHFLSLIICQAKRSQIATQFEVSSLNPETNKLIWRTCTHTHTHKHTHIYICMCVYMFFRSVFLVKNIWIT